MRRVDPKVYTKKYYKSDCTGSEEFNSGSGKKLNIIFQEFIKHFKIFPGMKILDIGCGRGEMVFYCASKGAVAIGIDYADAAISLSKNARTKQTNNIQKKTKFIKMDAKKLNFSNSSFDLILITSVIEHLFPEELELVFKEIKRVLKPDGIAYAYVAPNKIFNDIAYGIYCYPASSLITFFWNIFKKNKYPNIAKPNEIRTESHHIMHINEPTYFYLFNLYKKFNFKGKIFSTNVTVIKQKHSFKDSIFNLLVFLHPLSKYFPLNVVFGSDFNSLLINTK